MFQESGKRKSHVLAKDEQSFGAKSADGRDQKSFEDMERVNEVGVPEERRGVMKKTTCIAPTTKATSKILTHLTCLCHGIVRHDCSFLFVYDGGLQPIALEEALDVVSVWRTGDRDEASATFFAPEHIRPLAVKRMRLHTILKKYSSAVWFSHLYIDPLFSFYGDGVSKSEGEKDPRFDDGISRDPFVRWWSRVEGPRVTGFRGFGQGLIDGGLLLSRWKSGVGYDGYIFSPHTFPSQVALFTIDSWWFYGGSDLLVRVLSIMVSSIGVSSIRIVCFNQFENMPVGDDNTRSSASEAIVNGNGSSSSQNNVSMPFTPDQIMKLMSLISDKSGYGNAQANMAGINFISLLSKFKTFEEFKRWIIDSGANQHMVLSEELLDSIVDISDLNLTVEHPNGLVAKIKKNRNLKLNDKITLYDVLLVLEYYVNLISVYKLARDNKLFIGFDENKCYIQDLGNMISMGTGSQSDRLGHPVDQVLIELSKDLKISKDESFPPCEISHRAKQTREPFPNSDNRSTNVGDVIHLDVWGGIPLYFWTECVLIATYLINMLPSAVLKGKAPFEVLFRYKPSLNNLRCFGCLFFSIILNNSDKLSSRATKCVLLGYATNKKAYKLLSRDDKNIFYSRDVKFYEYFPYKINKSENVLSNDYEGTDHLNFLDTPYTSHNLSNDDNCQDTNSDSNVLGSISDTDDSETDTTKNVSDTDEVARHEEVNNVDSLSHSATLHDSLEFNNDNNIGISEDNTINDNSNVIRRSQRNTVLPQKFQDYVFEEKVKYEPKTFSEASKDKNWQTVMNTEMEALYKNNTWTLTKLPAGRKPVGKGIDYEESFSLIVKIATIRWCMTRSSTKELLLLLENPERVLRSRRKLFDNPSLVELNQPEEDKLYEIEEHIKEEVTEIMAETMEQYMRETREDYGSGVTI
ncbi:ribonuclease H-like domain-containing protein [Tanacetum coccineum]